MTTEILRSPERHWVLKLELSLRGAEREAFYEAAAPLLRHLGLLGIDEGTVLAEADGWSADVLDSAEAPPSRDWVGDLAVTHPEFYFDTESHARDAAVLLAAMPNVRVESIRVQEPQDWDAEWKKAFLKDPGGVTVPPFWRVLPPWASAEEALLLPHEKVIRVNPGAGFGTGTHETSQLCLGALAAALSEARELRVLDFGSGSGILSIAAALLGANALGVEVDSMANDNARENAALNKVEGLTDFVAELPDAGSFPVVVANILRPVLLEFADQLIARLTPGGTLILSGLLDSDVNEVRARYSALLYRDPKVHALRDWRCLVWS